MSHLVYSGRVALNAGSTPRVHESQVTGRDRDRDGGNCRPCKQRPMFNPG